jgi:hypothetical protein
MKMPGGVEYVVNQGGMTLRDYFAANALCGYYANPETSFQSTKMAADAMYAMADAMLARREGGGDA